MIIIRNEKNGISSLSSRGIFIIAALVLCFFTGCRRIDETVDYARLPEPVSEAADGKKERDKCYIYNRLTAEEQQCYDVLAEAVRGFESEAVFPFPVEPETMKKLFLAVYNQEEDIFWLSSIFYRPAEATDRMKLTYRYDREQSENMQKAVDAAVAEIFAEFDENTTDYEKLLCFHDLIVTRCTFGNETEYSNCVYGTLVEGCAQCEGYAFSFDYLCRLADIDCFTVTGVNPQGNAHAWNMVMLDGQWYHVDCTWDDPVLDIDDTKFLRHYYFLVRDSDIYGITHFPDTTYFSLPLCTASDNFYERQGYASDGPDAVTVMKRAASDAISAGKKDFGIRLRSRKAYNDAMTRLFDNKGLKEVLIYANASAPKRVLEGRYVRYLNEDEFIIQISMIYE